LSKLALKNPRFSNHSLRTAALSFLSSRPGFPATLNPPRSGVRLSLKERRMRSASAIKFNRKSGGAKPRDLRFCGPIVEARNPMLQQNCHLACSGPNDKGILAAYPLTPKEGLNRPLKALVPLPGSLLEVKILLSSNSAFPREVRGTAGSSAPPDFLSRVAASVNCVWFSLRRTTCVVAGESGEVGNPGTLRRKTFPRRAIHTEISPLRCAPVEMTKGRAALAEREVPE
jgi:hypothetical protein